MPPPHSELPRGYAETLGEIKQRIQQERIRVVMAANSAMVLLYLDIGRMIPDRQEREGWGAKVIDRLAKVIVEYALRDLKKPIGVAAWETKIVEKLPAELKGSLPTVEEIEAELAPRRGKR